MLKRVVIFLMVLTMSILVIGCSNNENNENEKVTSNNETVQTNSNGSFDTYNILDFGEIEVDDSKDYEGDKFVDIKAKVTNNSNEIIKTITIDFYFYDDENTMIHSTHPQEGSSIEANQSFYIDALYDRYMDLDKIKINKYSYYIGDTYYTVDLLSKTADVYE